MPEILDCTVGQQENILSIAHEQEILVSVTYEQEILFRITNGQEVFTNIPDEHEEDMSCLMNRSPLYS